MWNCGRCLIIPFTMILRNFEKKDIFVSLKCAISFFVTFSLWYLFAQALDKCKLGDAVRAKEKNLSSSGKSEELKERKKKSMECTNPFSSQINCVHSLQIMRYPKNGNLRSALAQTRSGFFVVKQYLGRLYFAV
jgi:hypothetical protein